MTDSYPSSTRLRSPSAATRTVEIHRSGIYCALLIVLLTCSLRALWICEMPVTWMVTCAFSLIALTIRALARNARLSLTLYADQRWRVQDRQGEAFDGRLLEAGYCSASLLVLVLEEELDLPHPIDTKAHLIRADLDEPGDPGSGASGRRRRRVISVFSDAVSDRDFSYLQFRQRFNGARP